jgi:hypothetical protein
MLTGPNNLLRVSSLRSAPSAISLFPQTTTAGSPVFASDEKVIWQGPLDAAVLRQKADDRPLAPIWEFPVAASVWVTNHRLLYVCKKFIAGEWKWAWTEETGVLVSAVNSIRAVSRRVGRIAVGQVRHEWPVDVLLMREKPALGRSRAVFGITCVDPWDDALVRLLLRDSDHAKVAGFTRMVIKTIGGYRLASNASIDAGTKSQLAHQIQSPVTREGEHPFGADECALDPFASRVADKPMFFVLGGAIKIS